MSYFLEYWSDRSEIWNTCWIWSFNYVYTTIRIFQKLIFVFDWTRIFYPKIKFLYLSRYFDLLSILSRVFSNSTQNHRKIRHFSWGIWLIIHDLHVLILTSLLKNHSFSIALPFEAIAIDKLGLIAPKLYTYSTFCLLKFIFHKKLQVVFGYRFFFFLFSILLSATPALYFEV